MTLVRASFGTVPRGAIRTPVREMRAGVLRWGDGCLCAPHDPPNSSSRHAGMTMWGCVQLSACVPGRRCVKRIAEPGSRRPGFGENVGRVFRSSSLDAVPDSRGMSSIRLSTKRAAASGNASAGLGRLLAPIDERSGQRAYGSNPNSVSTSPNRSRHVGLFSSISWIFQSRRQRFIKRSRLTADAALS